MELETYTYLPGAGWADGKLPALDSEQTLVLAFGASSYLERPAPLAELARAFPRAHLIGCSTAGEILGATLHLDSLVGAAVRFDHTGLQVATVPVSIERSFEAGAALVRQLDRPDLRGIFVLSDGHDVNGTALVRGMNEALNRAVLVTGGLAGDGDRFRRTWVLHEGRPRSCLVTAVGFYGDRVHIGHGTKGGWDIFGIERRITRAEGNVLYELDGRPALELYKEYLGERAAGLPATALLFPLALRMGGASDKQIVRTVLDIDEEQQSMTFAGDMPEGALAQLMRANFERLIDGAAEAALMTRQTATPVAGPVLSIAISCVGRRLVLGERVEEELEAALDVLPAQVHQVGFYSYGEISPYASGDCDLHNQTMTLTTIAED